MSLTLGSRRAYSSRFSEELEVTHNLFEIKRLNITFIRAESKMENHWKKGEWFNQAKGLTTIKNHSKCKQTLMLDLYLLELSELEKIQHS